MLSIQIITTPNEVNAQFTKHTSELILKQNDKSLKKQFKHFKKKHSISKTKSSNLLIKTMLILIKIVETIVSFAKIYFYLIHYNQH